MGSKELSGRQGNFHRKLNKNLNVSSLSEYSLEDLKALTIKGMQFGINLLKDNNKKDEKDALPQDYYSAPPAIGFHNEINNEIVDIGIDKNNCVHSFCFLEVEDLAESDEGIIIEFGEYSYGENNDFNVKSFYMSKKGGLRLYVVKTKSFENYCNLVKVKCTINKREILDDILVGISKNYKWRLEFYDKSKQNCHDFVVALIKYLEVQKYEICKGIFSKIPDKIKNVSCSKKIKIKNKKIQKDYKR